MSGVEAVKARMKLIGRELKHSNSWEDDDEIWGRRLKREVI
jgi:hypothetical protein